MIYPSEPNGTERHGKERNGTEQQRDTYLLTFTEQNETERNGIEYNRNATLAFFESYTTDKNEISSVSKYEKVKSNAGHTCSQLRGFYAPS